MKRIIKDLYKYWHYVIYATKSELKNDFVNSSLGWIWLILEPICFTLIYTFISMVVFDTRTEFFTVSVLVALSLWNFFNKTIVSSIKLVAANRDTVTKVYIPKFVLVIIKVNVNFFKMIISLFLAGILMLLFKTPITFNLLWFIPILLVSIIVTFAISCFVMHVGVFIEDLSNIMNIFMKLLFYLSGIFYTLSTVIMNVNLRNILINFNPIACFIENSRLIIINGLAPNYAVILLWFVLGVGLSLLAINQIYKYENTYVKVMK